MTPSDYWASKPVAAKYGEKRRRRRGTSSRPQPPAPFGYLPIRLKGICMRMILATRSGAGKAWTRIGLVALLFASTLFLPPQSANAASNPLYQNWGGQPQQTPDSTFVSPALAFDVHNNPLPLHG